ncbi:ketoacyl-synt-domain-containing protein [Clathrospora elynae]|uniref:Ketoacyl-synt-domain-containing protein n=1 Tax=Clathrospora elynae TaxID=706981 RepID=A0A6A5S8Z9_9PLEO|nr:ketoacyl-synt-domain-containing protein [Clathrospora elynae]
MEPSQVPEPIAIIGLGCRFPGGANSPEELWQMLADGRSSWSEVPADRYTQRSFHHRDPDTDAAHNQIGGGYIDRDLAAFDAAFFNIPTQEANALDPQQRIQLETAYEALESAGIAVNSVKGSRTSVHVATVSRDYDRNAYRDPQDLAKYHLTGCGEAITSGRISYTFDLRGPCMSLDTGCSGSLVGLHLACQGLQLKETDMALVGGTNLLLGPDMTMAMSKLHMLNDDGRCYAFDSRGNGYARSEGVATVVLKRLADAVEAGDPIRAIIRNTGVNQDGKTNGILLPNSQAQEELMRSIHVDAGLDPGLTVYVEAHGTGTLAGDAAEVNSIHKVFCDGIERLSPLWIGSIKANIGHAESASGLAGLIKTVLALEKGLIPPFPDVQNIKEGLDLNKKNIKIPKQLKQWPKGPRRAAINSFGYGGTNVAAIIDSYQQSEESIESKVNSFHPGTEKNGTDHDRTSKAPYLFVVSAKSAKSLNGNLRNLEQWLREQNFTEDMLRRLAHTLFSKRSHMPVRASILASTRQNFLSAVMDAQSKQPEQSNTKHQLTFVFTGQGAQWYAMGRELLHTETRFSESIRSSEKLLNDLGASWNLQEELERDKETSRINESEISQPATTALQIALVDLLDSFSIRPGSVVGHSSGEVAASYSIGALSHAAALRVSYARSEVAKLAKKATNIKGGMFVANLSEQEVLQYIERFGKHRISVACVNSPTSTTISGDRDAIEDWKAMLDNNSVTGRMLAVDVAYHSHHMKAVADQYMKLLDGLEVLVPRDGVRFFSSVTGKEKTTDFGAAYWVQNLVSTVRFSDALLASCGRTHAKIGSKGVMPVFVEIGPHSALSAPLRQTLTSPVTFIEHKYVSALTRGKDAQTTVVTLAGRLFEFGLEVDVEATNCLNGGESDNKMILDLPPYAWDYSNRYWYESRLSKEYRFRKHPYHDLLGLRLIGSTPLEPIWRNILSVDAQPWLQEHIIDGSAILPGASFLCMAMEAARQLNEETGGAEIRKFHMKNVTYSKAIMIPDSPGKLELMISLSSLDNRVAFSGRSEWERFRITSTSDTKTWTLNCSGYIRLEYRIPLNDVDNGREEERTLSEQRDRLSQADQDCTDSIQHDSLYEELRQNGIDYGTNFATIQKLRIGHCQALGEVAIPDVADCMPDRYMQPHTIHPATFDALMHIVLPLYSRHCSSGPVMLTSVDEVSVAADMVSVHGNKLTVCCALSPSGPRSGSVDVTAFQSGELGPVPVVVLRGEKFQGIGSATSTAPANLKSVPFHETYRPLKLSIGTPGVLSSLFFVDDEAAKGPLMPDEVEIKALAFSLDDSDVDAIVGRGSSSLIIGKSAGIVTAVGSDFKHVFHVGERVCCWNTTTAFASHTRAKGSFVQKVPRSWSFGICAALPQNMTMAYYGLQNFARAVAGQSVLIQGAGSPLGLAAIVVAGLFGLNVLATVNNRAQKDGLLSLPSMNPENIYFNDDFAVQRNIMRFKQGLGVDVLFNASSAPLTEEVMASVAPFGAIIDITRHGHHRSTIAGTAGRAIRYTSLDPAQLLRHRPFLASTAFKEVMALLQSMDLEKQLPRTAIPLMNAVLAFKTVKAYTQTGQVVLVADDETLVNVREAAAPGQPVDLDRIIQTVKDLSAPKEQKEELLALLNGGVKLAENAGAAITPATESNRAGPNISDLTKSTERRLKAASSIAEVHQIALEAIAHKVASLVALGSDHLDMHISLADVGLDSLIAIDFKNWLSRSLGAAMRTHEILDAAGLDSLAALVAERSTNDLKDPNPLTNGVMALKKSTPQKSPDGASRFTVNRLPKYPFFDLPTLLDSYLTSVKALATPAELSHTLHAIEAFQEPGSTGQILYERAAAMASDPKIENWESELQLCSAFLNRRAPLVPFSSFWFSHPLSERMHEQAERAALVAVTAFEYKCRLESGAVKPMVLNEKELTNTYYEWIFSALRMPCAGSDKMVRFPGNDYCVVIWKGHAFRLDLLTRNVPATYDDLRAQFELILSQQLERSWTGILTSDNRHIWAEKRMQLQQVEIRNKDNLAVIEAAAFIICLDSATPDSAPERARQFHFGGEEDAANRWNDKSLQFVVCRNGASGVIGEHTMLDALTLSQLNDALATAIRDHKPASQIEVPARLSDKPNLLAFTMDAAISTHVDKVRADYLTNTSSAEHNFLNYTTYGATFLRNLKCAPKSIFQIVVQIAALQLFGYTPACWETVSVAHFQKGRVEVIQIILPAMAAFLSSTKSSATTQTTLKEQRALLLDAMREHASAVSKASRGLGVERNLSALRMLLERGEETPSLFEDAVYKRARPRKIMSHCFQTGMLEKGFLFRDTEAVWVHYEVYEARYVIVELMER